MSTFLTFMAVALVINLTPGPAMVHCVSIGVRNGARAGVIASLGVELGVFVYVVATVLGLAALLVAATAVYTAVQVAGILFLLYLAWTSVPRKSDVDNTFAVDSSGSVERPFLKGFLLNVSNPKIALFFLTLLPQFVPPDKSTAFALLGFGILFNVSGLLVNTSAAVLGERLAPAVAKLGVARTVLPWAPPVAFFGLAIYSATSLVLGLTQPA